LDFTANIFHEMARCHAGCPRGKNENFRKNPNFLILHVTEKGRVVGLTSITDFVLENGVGIAVDSLYGLDQIIADIPDEEYRVMCENASRL